MQIRHVNFLQEEVLMNVPSQSSIPQLRLIAWELTKSCVLSCNIAGFCIKENMQMNSPPVSVSKSSTLLLPPVSAFILTGGEPMLREDIYQLARYGTDKGLRMVMATCELY